MSAFLTRVFAHLRAHPSRPFISEVHGHRLTRAYGGRMLEWIGQARGQLRARGIRPGSRVALLAPNSARWVEADLSVLAEGAVVVPLYARQAPEELAYMVRHSGAELVVASDAGLRDGVRGQGVDVPAVVFDELFTGPSLDEAPRDRAPDDLMTIVYTSGTSGRPKGVMSTAGNVDFMVRTIDGKLTELLGTRGGSDRVFHYLPFVFSGSRFVLWSNLYRANGLMVSTDITNLAEELRTAAPEWCLNVPALLERLRSGVEERIGEQPLPVRALYDGALAAWRRELADQASVTDVLLLAAARRWLLGRVRQELGPNLRCLICGSAPLAPETQAWFDLLDLPVYQVYGLTETTAIVSMDRPDQALPGTVGFPLDGVDVRLGEAGELQVRGPNVFGGYWNDPEATAAAFTEDGFFRTGDRASIDAEGRLAIIGRLKNLLIPESGHNVPPEPLELEIATRIDGVEHAVVVGHGRPYLVAVLSGDADRDAVQRGLDELNRDLPHYRRIRAFHLAAAAFTTEGGLLTANRKVRRGAVERRYADEIEALYRSGS